MISPAFFPLFGTLSTTWWQLANDTGEMFVAASLVVGHRTTRMAMAGPLPSTRDRDEFSLMSSEKNDAGAESAAAIGSGLMTLGVNLAMETNRQMWAASSAMIALNSATSTPTQRRRGRAAMMTIIGELPTHTLHLANSATRLVHDGLAPIHLCATANARRLGAS